jgi:pyruvate dehydrogenase E2 component (dihydrolipoamide acetyltransferase)
MDDVKAHAKKLVSGLGKGARLSATAPLPDFERWGEIEREAMTGVRRKTAEHLSQSWTAPHVTNHDQADITELEKLRKHYQKRVEAAGGKLTMTAIALKIAASALKVFPQFNASVDMESDEIVFKKYIHIGVAVDTERGLLVPVIRNVDQKNIVTLAVELSDVAEKARARKLTLDEMQGGTFTITNLGGIGGTAFTPILNWPEVAILGISRASKVPVWVESAFEPRLMLPLSLSYDHRLIDGADAARFLRWLVEAFENPFLLSLEG